jgi:spore coat polysaccharide biosynthesis protein SpsF (cytidylyltransferase family)
MKVVALVQARMTSTRLPGKVLNSLCGMPMIIFMLQRVAQAECVDEVVLATSTDKTDDALADIVQAHGFGCFRGELHDVLSRFHGAARAAQADVVVRLTGDCPLIDADLIDTVVRTMQSSAADYASNTSPPTYPDGLDIEAFSFGALDQAWRAASLNSEREHVTPYLRNRPELFKIASVCGVADFSHLRWTVDYPDDYQFICQLLESAGVNSPTQGDRFDFLRALERYPELLAINQHQRNEGYTKSLAQDHKTPLI